MDILRSIEMTLSFDTWLPQSYKRIISYFLLSNVIGRRVLLKVGGEYYANLFIFLVGEPSTGKSTALKKAKIALYNFQEYINSKNSKQKSGLMQRRQKQIPYCAIITPDEFSPEALMDFIIERENRQYPVVFIEDEFSNLITQSKNYKKDAFTVICKLFDNDKITKRLVKRGTALADNIYFSFGTGCQPDIIEEILSKRELSSGFLSRFIIVYDNPEKEIIPEEPPQTLADILISVENIFSLFEDYPNVKLGMGITEEAWKFIGEQAELIQNEIEEDIILFFKRIRDYILKLSIIIKFNDFVAELLSVYSDAVLKTIKLRYHPMVGNEQFFDFKNNPVYESDVCIEGKMVADFDDDDQKFSVYKRYPGISVYTLNENQKIPQYIFKFYIEKKHAEQAVEFIKSLVNNQIKLLYRIASTQVGKTCQHIKDMIIRYYKNNKLINKNDKLYIRNRDIVRTIYVPNKDVRASALEILIEEELIKPVMIKNEKLFEVDISKL